MREWDAQGKIDFPKDKSKQPNRKIYADEYKGQPVANLWTDIPVINPVSRERLNFDGQKPEALIQRILTLTTRPGDLVLDSFAGSGTTGAVAHKMGRRWIMIEQGEHCHSFIVPRLQRVIDGNDPGGITDSTAWTGGGGFRYFSLASSMLETDGFGNWIISKRYNGTMLAEAMCKHMGFTYAPSETEYWRHGYSSERDFMYVTTQSLTHDQLKRIADDVGDARTLVVCCKAFKARLDAFPNLTVKKIPLAVLAKCEWGRDDYSMGVAALMPVRSDEVAETEEEMPPPRKRGRSKARPTADLFDEENGTDV